MPNTVLRMLGADPDEAFARYAFVCANSASGGRCSIDIAKLDDGVYTLSPNFGGAGHFFYPYTHGGVAAVGCTVPFGQRDGTIVITGAMNGCSLQVNRSASGFDFYHDKDSCTMQGNERGEIVARVGPKDYDRLDLGSKGVAQIAEETKGAQNAQYAAAVICIHHGGKWKVYASTAYVMTATKGLKKTARRFVGSITPLITSFADE